ncbi:YggS family pyridoxal phosphate-dependent enzyme [Marinoscillum furvescens]|uniref:Pyridoxal phosphate homeostasis protein n=1 Tax=Marinoscillum furvescens DSM 4134 TaxID=1122208 RepID=A0A3D9L3G3_MARFU|nr:YggS family pyridoxal phosphate-dependent enzyme [Marinoscillum furvescens]RED97510.1 hypothetical protein C7460_112120 [Marinoscillum furvescens DSM 4134]
MSNIAENLSHINHLIGERKATLVAISKTKPISDIEAAYRAGQRHFGENKVQEMTEKSEHLPKDIKWHMVGHLQRNKVKYIAPYVHLIHSVDSLRLLKAINKEATKNNRVINCLLQVHIAEESTKFGFDAEELYELLSGTDLSNLEHIKISGLMGMATNTSDTEKVKQEFLALKQLFDEIRERYTLPNLDLSELSMGMSGDFEIALDCGSSMIRVGSLIFGARNYG